jgi:hypothetical protein
MNGRKSKGHNRNKNEKPKNIIRCGLNQLIVWDNELCSNFIINREISSEKNCKYSY